MTSPVFALALLALASVLPTTAADRPAAACGALEGKVTETMNAAGYTYFLVDTGSRQAWVAATEVAMKVGDLVLVTGALATNRDFGGGCKYPLIVEDAQVVVE